MICCDVCWVVLGKSLEAEDMLDDNRLHFIGKWEVCKLCLEHYENLVFEDVKSKVFKKN